jgi:hypothetical protein
MRWLSGTDPENWMPDQRAHLCISQKLMRMLHRLHGLLKQLELLGQLGHI